MRARPRNRHHAKPRQPRVAPAQSDNGNGATQAREGPAAGPRRKCVLVVEDNATIGGLLVALLREEGYRALRAWDGREAIKMARDRRPDLIVLDLSLPYRDGLEVLHELKANEETKVAPIVVVSGNTLELGQDDRDLLAETVGKPFDIDKLMNVFRRHLGDPEQDLPERHYDAHDSHLHSW
jgi:DNA-binding response OmpR family regulator